MPLIVTNLRRAVVASLLLHAVVLSLFAVAVRSGSHAPIPGLQVSLREAAVAVPPASVNPAGSVRERPAVPRPRMLPVTPVPADLAGREPANRRPIHAESPVAMSATVGQADRGGGGTISSAPASLTAGRAESAVTPSEGPPVDGLRQYRLALGREARKLKQEIERRYSDIERDSAGREGRVEMTVRGQAGAPPTVSLARTSGHAALDQQALELLGRAVRVTELPRVLLGQTFSMPVALEFRLGE